MPSGKTSDEGLSYEKSGASMGESARAVVAILLGSLEGGVALGCSSSWLNVCELMPFELCQSYNKEQCREQV